MACMLNREMPGLIFRPFLLGNRDLTNTKRSTQMTPINSRNHRICQSNTYLSLLRKDKILTLKHHRWEELSSHLLQSYLRFLLSICQLPIERLHSLNSSKSKVKVTTSMAGASPQVKFIMHTTKKKLHIRGLMARKSKTCECHESKKSAKVCECLVIRYPLSLACSFHPFLIFEPCLLQGYLGFYDVLSNMQQLDLACF